jgi:hypothetical protein
MATSWQTRGKRGGDASRQRGCGVLKAGGALRQQEVEVARQEDERRRRRIVRTRGKGGGGGGATRGNTTTSQGKLEVNRRQTPKGLADKDYNDEAPQTGRILSANAVKPLNLSNKITRVIRGMEGSTYRRGGHMSCFLLPPSLALTSRSPPSSSLFVPVHESFVPMRRYPPFCDFVMLGCTVSKRKRHCVCHSGCHCGIENYRASPSLCCLHPPPHPHNNCQYCNGAGICNPCYCPNTHQTTLTAPARCA